MPNLLNRHARTGGPQSIGARVAARLTGQSASEDTDDETMTDGSEEEEGSGDQTEEDASADDDEEGDRERPLQVPARAWRNPVVDALAPRLQVSDAGLHALGEAHLDVNVMPSGKMN